MLYKKLSFSYTTQPNTLYLSTSYTTQPNTLYLSTSYTTQPYTQYHIPLTLPQNANPPNSTLRYPPHFPHPKRLVANRGYGKGRQYDQPRSGCCGHAKIPRSRADYLRYGRPLWIRRDYCWFVQGTAARSLFSSAFHKVGTRTRAFLPRQSQNKQSRDP